MVGFTTQYHPNIATGSNVEHGFFIQPKLAINNLNNKYEREADALAARIMRMEIPGPQAANKHTSFFNPAPVTITSIQRKCAHCEEEEKKSDGFLMQRKEMDGAENDDVEKYIDKLTNTGKPLSNKVRSFYGPRFGYDYSNVKAHTNSVVAKSEQSINATAYTSGNNMVFNNEKFDSDTDDGKSLLGHELTHIIQRQSNSLAGDFTLQRRPDKDVPAKAVTECPVISSLEAIVKSSSAVSDTCGKKCRLELGCCPTERGKCGSDVTSGAVIKAIVDIPKDCTGELGFMQNVLSTDRKRTLFDKSEECLTTAAPHVDGGVPYKGCKLVITAPGQYSLETDDCPSILLEDDMKTASAKDLFKTFLLWKKSGDKGWKPIANVTWSWNASTTRKKGKDCSSNWTSPAGKSAGNKVGVSSDKPVSTPDIREEKWGKCGEAE